jgi:hypothetical protein
MEWLKALPPFCLFPSLLFLVDVLRGTVFPLGRDLFRLFFLFLKPGRVLVEATVEPIDNAIVNDEQFVASTSQQVPVVRNDD